MGILLSVVVVAWVRNKPTFGVYFWHSIDFPSMFSLYNRMRKLVNRNTTNNEVPKLTAESAMASMEHMHSIAMTAMCVLDRCSIKKYIRRQIRMHRRGGLFLCDCIRSLQSIQMFQKNAHGIVPIKEMVNSM